MFIIECPKLCPDKCGCIGRYIKNNNNGHTLDYFNKLYNEALYLNSKRYLDTIAPEQQDDKCVRTLGCGKKKSFEYFYFVKNHREILKSMGICEKARKKILLYSNNFFYRKLKHDNENRNKLVSGGKLKDKLILIENLVSIKCCSKLCTSIISEDLHLVKKWRSLSFTENRQKSLQNVIIIMSNYKELNFCKTFIHLITGASRNTIRRVQKSLDNENNIKLQKESDEENVLKKLIETKNDTIDNNNIEENEIKCIINNYWNKLKDNIINSTNFTQPILSSINNNYEPTNNIIDNNIYYNIYENNKILSSTINNNTSIPLISNYNITTTTGYLNNISNQPSYINSLLIPFSPNKNENLKPSNSNLFLLPNSSKIINLSSLPTVIQSNPNFVYPQKSLGSNESFTGCKFLHNFPNDKCFMFS